MPFESVFMFSHLVTITSGSFNRCRQRAFRLAHNRQLSDRSAGRAVVVAHSTHSWIYHTPCLPDGRVSLRLVYARLLFVIPTFRVLLRLGSLRRADLMVTILKQPMVWYRAYLFPVPCSLCQEIRRCMDYGNVTNSILKVITLTFYNCTAEPLHMLQPAWLVWSFLRTVHSATCTD